MRPGHFFHIFLLSTTLLGSCASQKDDTKPEFILRLGHQANESDIWHKSCVFFAEQVMEQSEGKIDVRVYAAEQLGRERDMIRSIQAGISDMTTTGETMQNWASITSFCAIPYLIQDSDHLRKVVEGPIGQQIAAAMIREIGLRPLAYFERGARNLTSNRPIRHPDDLQGIILRVPNVPVFVQTWQSLGAKTTPMTFSEVFTALQQGTVEAQENPYALINSAGFYEVQKYVNLTEHVIGWVYMVIGEAKFQSLPIDLQEIVLRAGKDTQYYHQKLFREEEKTLRKKLEDHGMEFIEVNKDAFMERSREAVLTALPDEHLPVYRKIAKLK
jgi:tripartite ATP-independent transporter DctP family solute receptor